MLLVKTADEAKAIAKSEREKGVDKKDRTHIIYPNKDECLVQHKDTINTYEDLLRRFSYKDDPTKYALEGSHYDNMYRMKIMRNGEAIGKLRKWSEQSKTRDVILVSDGKYPDADILYDICRVRLNNRLW